MVVDDMGAIKNPKQKTIKRLFALSGNICAFLKCTTPVVNEEGIILGDICHIKGKNPDAPRYDRTQTSEERNGFENLILICKIHHKIIDDDPESYTVDRLVQMKKEHEGNQKPSEITLDDSQIISLIENIEHTVNFNFESIIRNQHLMIEKLRTLDHSSIGMIFTYEKLSPIIMDILSIIETENWGAPTIDEILVPEFWNDLRFNLSKRSLSKNYFYHFYGNFLSMFNFFDIDLFFDTLFHFLPLKTSPKLNLSPKLYPKSNIFPFLFHSKIKGIDDKKTLWGLDFDSDTQIIWNEGISNFIKGKIEEKSEYRVNKIRIFILLQDVDLSTKIIFHFAFQIFLSGDKNIFHAFSVDFYNSGFSEFPNSFPPSWGNIDANWLDNWRDIVEPYNALDRLNFYLENEIPDDHQIVKNLQFINSNSKNNWERIREIYKDMYNPNGIQKELNALLLRVTEKNIDSGIFIRISHLVEILLAIYKYNNKPKEGELFAIDAKNKIQNYIER